MEERDFKDSQRGFSDSPVAIEGSPAEYVNVKEPRPKMASRHDMNSRVVGLPQNDIFLLLQDPIGDVDGRLKIEYKSRISAWSTQKR